MVRVWCVYVLKYAAAQNNMSNQKIMTKDSVEIRRGDAGVAVDLCVSQLLEVEGSLGDEYFKVRDAVYKMYSAV